MGARTGQRRRLRPSPGLLTALVAILAFSAFAGAPAVAAAPAARLSVVVGDAGGFIPGRPAPVRVGIRSDRLIAGQMFVTSGSFQTVQPVEVAGGSNKQFEVVVPTAVGQGQLRAEVTVIDRGTVLASLAQGAVATPDTEVVGVMPELLLGRALAGPARLSVDVGTARFVSVTDQDLSLAPGSLGPLSAVALGPDGLARLSPEARWALLAWTAGGGRLLIDARPGDPVAGLPVDWQPNGALRVVAGTGQVVVTSGIMAAGKWDGLVDPMTHGAGAANSSSFGGGGVFLSSSLASDAGLKTPGLAWLIAFLLLYIALVGPVSFFVLRSRHRPDLLWVVIPLVALVFAGSGYAVSSSAHAGVRVVHGTIIDTTVAGGTALTYVGVLSAGQGTSRVDVPGGWVMQRYNDFQGPQGGPSTVGLKSAATRDGMEGKVSLDAGQFAVIQASGPAGYGGRLAVTAHPTSGSSAEGTVINRTAYRLEDVSVLIGGAGADIGSLAPGATASWTVSDVGTTSASPSIESQLWRNSSSSGVSSGGWQGCAAPVAPPGAFGGPGAMPVCGASSTGGGGGAASLAVWTGGPDGLGPGSRRGGVAVAVGWTRGYQPPVSVGGHGHPAIGRTAIVGTAALPPLGATGDLAMWRQVVRSNLSQVGPGMFMDTNNTGQPTVVNWALPPAAAGHPLALAVPAGAGEVDVWSDRTWRKVTDAAPASGGSGPMVTVVPPATASAPVAATTVPSTGAVMTPATGTGATPPQTLLVPGPQPFMTGPVPNGPAGTGAVTTSTLGPADIGNGAVYVRVSGGGFNQPFNLDALRLTVLP